MLKKIFIMVAMLIMTATAATAEVNIINPQQTYIYTDYRHVGKVLPGTPAANRKMHWQPVYVIGILSNHMRMFDDRGVSIHYCSSPKTPDYAQFMPNPPMPCEPIFIELYTVPVPNQHPLFLSPIDIYSIVEGVSAP